MASVLVAYAWMGVWICLSIAIIMVNKYVIFYSGFHFPVTLALWHMLLASAMSRISLWALDLPDVLRQQQSRKEQFQLITAGALFGASLVAGNAALLYLSVPTIQMLKALCPVSVYVVGTLLGTETPTWLQSSKVLVVSAGVTIAGLGDVTFHLLGIFLQLASIVMDSLRCCKLQRVMQAKHMQAGPLVTLAHVAPYAAASLVVPVLALEGRALMLGYNDWARSIPAVVLSGALAVVLNIVIFKLIHLTSALTMSLTGVFKDWVCILLAVHLYNTVVTPTQWFGFSVAIAGLMWYHYGKVTAVQTPTAPTEDTECALAASEKDGSVN